MARQISLTPVTSRNQFTAVVSANVPLCREHYRLVLSLPAFPTTRPGQFVQVACQDLLWSLPAGVIDRDVQWRPGVGAGADNPELLSPVAMLRRPFSLAGRRDLPDRVELDIIHRVVGTGTHWLADLKPGRQVGILGPLGNVFELPDPEEIALLVGGGVGIPPMIYLASALTGRKAVAFAGALTRDLLPLSIGAGEYQVGEFASHEIPTVIATDDASLGFGGFVTQALEAYLDGRLPNLSPGRSRCLIYTCGPEPMMKRVADIAMQRGLRCQVAVERAMACGMGTCQSCCIRVKKSDPALPPLPGREWCYRLACTDGPIFPADRLLW